jgi:hypothetical protein
MSEIATIKDNFRGDWETEASPGQHRSLRVREAHVARLIKDNEQCSLCQGSNHFQGSTGGFVELTSNKRMDYRAYTYWLHQPKKFQPEAVVRAKYMCTDCGGTGTRPAGLVFGMFVPDRIEFVTRPGAKMVGLSKGCEGFVVSSNEGPKRRAGKRTTGYYATTNVGGEGLVVRGFIDELVRLKIIPGAEMFSEFALFKTPLRVDSKRFRGIAKFSIERLKRSS